MLIKIKFECCYIGICIEIGKYELMVKSKNILFSLEITFVYISIKKN